MIGEIVYLMGEKLEIIEVNEFDGYVEYKYKKVE